ncbi:MAG: phosphatidylserine decarboxylase family protein [Rhodothermales bacterium]
MFAREGYALIGAAAVIAALLIVIGLQFSVAWRYVFITLGAFVLAFTLYFFRDPGRTPPSEAEDGMLVLAPADGKVVVVAEDVHEPLYLKGRARQVSIFLSPLNVHVNRIPTDGIVEHVNYVSGDYLVAWHPKASEMNERSEIGVRHPSGARVLFKQIAGAVARRIVYHVQEGDSVRAGERFGIVKFGSRMDVLVPPHVEIVIEEGDRVRAGETIIGRIPDVAPAGDESAPAREEMSSE